MVSDIGTKPKVGDAFLYNRARLLGYEYVYEGWKFPYTIIFLS